MKTNETDKVNNIVNRVNDAFAAVKNPPKRGKPGRPAKYGPKQQLSRKEHTVSSVKALIKKHIKEVGDKVKTQIKTEAKKVKANVKVLNSKLKSHTVRNPAEEKDSWAVTVEIPNRGEKVISAHRTKETADAKHSKVCSAEKGQCQVRKVSGKHSRYEMFERTVGEFYVKPRSSVVKNPPTPVTSTEKTKLGERESVIDTLAKAIVAGSKAGLTVDKSVAKFQVKHNFKCGESLIKAACKVAMDIMIKNKSIVHNNPPKDKKTNTTVVSRGGSFAELTKKK